MTILDLMKQAKEREISLTSVAFEYWDYLDQENQRALAKELCATFEDNYERDLVCSLYENQSDLFYEHYVKQIDLLIEEGEGGSANFKDVEELLDFVIHSTPTSDFTKQEQDEIDAYFNQTLYHDEDECYFTITCDFLNLLDKIREVLVYYML